MLLLGLQQVRQQRHASEKFHNNITKRGQIATEKVRFYLILSEFFKYGQTKIQTFALTLELP
jgi:hypothetical protein